jgi:hypothetical protein
MPEHQCEIDGAVIVLLGSFNPAIFHPAWLAHHKLIRQEESDSATVRVVLPQISDFTAGWLTLQVTTERLAASTDDASKFQPLSDVVCGMFTMLEHVPATAVGFNRTMHYKLPTEQKYKAFGDMLAPKPPWQAHLSEPGLLTQTMRGKRSGASSAHVHFKVETSVRVKPYGVYFESTEHFEPGGKEVSALLKIVKESAIDSLHYGRIIAEHLLSQEY